MPNTIDQLRKDMKQPLPLGVVPVSISNNKPQNSLPSIDEMNTKFASYTAKLADDTHMFESLGRYAESYNNTTNGTILLRQAQAYNDRIGMNQDEISSNSVKAIGRTIVVNVADVAVQKAIEEYKKSGDVTTAIGSAEKFIQSNISDLSTFGLSSDNNKFIDRLNMVTTEDLSTGNAAIYDNATQKLYSTTLGKGVTSQISPDSFVKNLWQGTIQQSQSSMSWAIQAIAGVANVFASSGDPELYDDQIRNPYVMNQIKDDTSWFSPAKAVGYATDIGNTVGISATTIEMISTGGLLTAMKAPVAVSKGLPIASMVIRGTQQDMFNTESLAPKYFKDQEFQKAHVMPMVASRAFDVATAGIGSGLSDVAKGAMFQYAGKKIVAQAATDAVKASKSLAVYGVAKAVVNPFIDIGTEAAVDITMHNLLTNSFGDKIFTESQMQTLDWGYLSEDKSMLARYIGMKVLGRSFNGVIRDAQVAKANKGTQYEGKDWMQDPQQDYQLHPIFKGIKRVAELFDNDNLTQLDDKFKRATSKPGTTGVGLRNILTDKSLYDKVTSDLGIQNAFFFKTYMSHSLANNVTLGLMTGRNGSFFGQGVNDLLHVESQFDNIRRLSELQLGSEPMDYTTRADGTPLKDNEVESAVSSTVRMFLNPAGKPVGWTQEIGLEELKAYAISGNMYFDRDVKQSKMDIQSVLDTAVQKYIEHTNPVDSEQANSLYKSWAKTFVVDPEERTVTEETIKRMFPSVDYTAYKAREFEAREQVATAFGLKNNQETYLNNMYSNKDKILENLSELRYSDTSNPNHGKTTDMWQRLSSIYNSDVRESLESTSIELSRTFSNLHGSIDPVTKQPVAIGSQLRGEDFANIDRSMLEAGKAMLLQSQKKLEAIRVSNESEEVKAQNYILTMQDIRNLGLTFGHKIHDEIYNIFYNPKNGLGEETKKNINDVLSTIADKENVSRLIPLFGEQSLTKAKESDLLTNIWASFYNGINTIQQRQFITATALAGLLKDKGVSRYLNKVEAFRLANPGVRVEGSDVMINLLMTSSKVVALPLFQDDIKPIVYERFIQALSSGAKDQQFNKEELKDVLDVAISKAMSSYLKETSNGLRNSLGAKTYIVESINHQIDGLRITDADLSDRAIDAIIMKYDRPNSVSELESHVYNILRSDVISSATNDEELKQQIYGALNLFSSDDAVSRDTWDISQDFNMPFARFTWRTNGKENHGTYSDYIEALERGLGDDGFSIYGSCKNIIAAAKSGYRARDGVETFIDRMQTLSNTQLLDVSTKDGVVVNNALLGSVIAGTITSDILNNRYESITVDPVASTGNTKATFAKSSVSNLNVNNRTGMIFVDVNNDEYSPLLKMTTSQLDAMGIFKVGQGGPSGVPVFVVIPGYKHTSKSHSELIATSKVLGGLADKLNRSQLLDAHGNKLIRPVIDAFNNIANQTGEDIVKEYKKAINLYKAFVKSQLQLVVDKYEDYESKLTEPGKAKNSQLSVNQENEIIKSKIGTLLSLGNVPTTFDLPFIGRIIPTNSSMNGELINAINAISSRFVGADIDANSLRLLIDSVEQLGVHVDASIRDAIGSANEHLDKISSYEYMRKTVGNYDRAEQRILSAYNGPAYFFAKQAKKQIANIDSEDVADVKTGKDVFTNLVKLMYQGEMFVTANDIQKRIGGINIGDTGVVARYIEDEVTNQLNTHPNTRIIFFSGDNNQTAGAGGVPSWVINMRMKTSHGQGNKYVINGEIGYEKLMMVDSALIVELLKVQDKPLVDQFGNEIDKNTLSSNDIYINTETVKSIGTGLVPYLNDISMAPSAAVKHNLLTIDDPAFVRTYLVDEIKIHSELRPSQRPGNMAGQPGDSDPVYRKIYAQMMFDDVKSIIGDINATKISSLIESDPELAWKELQSIYNKGVKHSKYTCPLVPSVPHNANNSIILGGPIRQSYGNQTIKHPMVGVDVIWMLDQIASSKDYHKRGNNGSDIWNRLSQSRLNPDRALVVEALDYLSTQKEGKVAKINGNYFLAGVRFPAQNEGQFGLFHVGYVRRFVQHGGIEADKTYMPELQKSDFDGDYMNGMPINTKTLKRAFGDDSMTDARLLEMMGERVANAYEIAARNVDATIVGDPNTPYAYIDTPNTKIAQGTMIKMVSDFMEWSNVRRDAIQAKLSSLMTGYFKKVFDPNNTDIESYTPFKTYTTFNQDNMMTVFNFANGHANALGNVVGNVLGDYSFKFGNKTYKIAPILTGNVGTQAGDDATTRREFLVLESDYDGSKFALNDFGYRVIGTLVSNTPQQANLIDSMKRYSTASTRRDGMRMGNHINTVLNVVSSSHSNYDINKLMTAIGVPAECSWKDLRSEGTELRLTNQKLLLSTVNNTGTDAAKLHGIEAIMKRRSTTDLSPILNEINEGILASQRILIDKFHGGSMTQIGNFLTNATTGYRLKDLPGSTVVQSIKEEIFNGAEFSLYDFASVKSLLSGTFIEPQQFDKVFRTVQKIHPTGNHEEIAAKYGNDFALVHSILKQHMSELYGLENTIGINADVFHKSYLGTKDETAAILTRYYNNTYTLRETTDKTRVDDAGKPKQDVMLFVHSRFNKMLQSIRRITDSIVGIDDVTNLSVVISQIQSKAYLKLSAPNNVSSEQLSESVISSIVARAMKQNPEDRITENDVSKALSELGLWSGGLNFSSTRVTGKGMLNELILLAGEGITNIAKVIKDNPVIANRLLKYSNEYAENVVSIVNKSKQPITAGQLVDKINSVLNTKRDNSEDDVKKLQSIYTALTDLASGQVQQTVFLRKIGLSSEVEAIVKSGLPEMRKNNKVATNYDMDIKFADASEHQRYTRQAIGDNSALKQWDSKIKCN